MHEVLSVQHDMPLTTSRLRGIIVVTWRLKVHREDVK